MISGVQPESLWVAELLISDWTAHKIRTQHGLDPDDVRHAVLCTRGLVFGWNEHPERGLRALVRTVIRGREVLIVLYPAGDDAIEDVYHLGSAYHLHNEG
jgi:hypothetical protein